MPFLSSLTEEELKKQQAAQSGGATISGQSSVLNAGAPQGQKGQSSSGQFQNLNTFLDANKDNTSAMADKIVGDVGSSVDEANKATNTFRNSAGPEVKLETADSLNQTYYNDPAKANKADYTATKANYKGPELNTDVAGYDSAVKTTNAAKNKVAGLSGDVGEAARNSFGQNQAYSAGANKLDSALLGRDKAAQAKIKGASTQFQGINDLLSGATNEVSNKIATNKSNTSANQNLMANQENAAITGQKSALQAKADAENLKQKNLNNLYASAAPDSFSQMSQNQDSGLSGAQYDQNVDWHNFFNQGTGTATAGSVASPDEAAKFSALAGLMDKSDTLDTGQGFTQSSFNRSGYDSAVSAEQAKRAAAQKIIDDKAAADAQAAQNVLNSQTLGAKSSTPQKGAPVASGVQDDLRVLSDDGFLKKYGIPKSAYNDPGAAYLGGT